MKPLQKYKLNMVIEMYIYICCNYIFQPLYFGHYSFFKEVDDNEKIQKLLLKQKQIEMEKQQSQQTNRFFDTPQNSFDD